jgi:thioredoxin reductase
MARAGRRTFIKQGGLGLSVIALSSLRPDINKFIIMENKITDNTQQMEVAIIGGGAAGLSAALFLVRSRRKIVIFDHNKKRISATPKIHEYIGFEGMTPDEYHERGANEIKIYGGEIRKERVLTIEKLSNGDFLIKSDNSQVVSKALILATGLVDVLPDIKGLKEGWGKDIHVCPCFTGYELHDKNLVVFGLQERLGQLGKFLTAWSKNVTVISKDAFDAENLRKLNATGVKTIYGEAKEVVRTNNMLQHVVTSAGEKVPADAVFVSAPTNSALLKRTPWEKVRLTDFG